MQTGFIDVQGITIEVCESAGSGTPIVLSHGNSADAQTFAPILAGDVGQRHRLIALSFPGHGRSQPAPSTENYAIPALGGFIAAAIDALGLERYVLAGHSLGGHAMLEALPQFRGALGLLLLCAPPIHLGVMGDAFADPTGGALFSAQLDAEQAQALAECFLAHPTAQTLQALREAILRTDVRFRPALLASLGQGRMLDEVAAFADATIPIGLVMAERDRFLNQDYPATLDVGRLWRGAVQVLPDCGHAVHVEAPERVAELLAAFAADVEGAAA